MEIRLTKNMIASSRVIARGQRIREIQELVDTYGGQPSKWVKKSTTPLEIDGRLAEIHWYECHNVGKVKLKIKWI